MPMKQRITPEQLQELTDEQRKKLRKWWEPDHGDFFTQTVDGENYICTIPFPFSDSSLNHFIKNGKKHSLPVLSIGQMIELLDDMVETFEIFSFDIHGFSPNFKVITHNQDGVFDNDSLCDCLFQAVKEVL